jgi:hypothetical protein
MLILFDHCTPRTIARWLHGHTVVEAIARGWDRLANGALLTAAEEAGFDLLLSTDKNIQYQQNLRDRRIASAAPHHCFGLGGAFNNSAGKEAGAASFGPR